MAKYRDQRSLGRSNLVPFKPGEDASERHRRRLIENNKEAEIIFAWCDVHGCEVRINNDGHHWIIEDGASFIAEWWPSSAKLVLSKRWSEGIHCHDVEQLRKELDREIARLS